MTPADGTSRGWRIGRAALFWTAVGLFFSTQTFINAQGQANAWSIAFRANLPRWYLWGALTPLVVLGDRWAVARSTSLATRLAWHVPLGIIWCSVHNALLTASAQALGLGSGWSLAGFVTLYHWNLLIYAVIVGGTIVYDYHTQAQERVLRASQLEARLADARLHALKAQLHPHFLFNTLHAISAFMESDPKTARRMTAHLGDMLRHSLDHGDEQEISLADELTVVEDYLAIQKIRFTDNLDVEIDVAPQVLSARVPNLILQPLIENAVRHGLADRPASGRITLRAHRLGSKLNSATCPKARSRTHKLELRQGRPADVGFRTNTGRGRGLVGTAILANGHLPAPWRFTINPSDG